MNAQTQQILSKLKALPIFKLSLGSKELFHSNFLEFIWEMEDKKGNRISKEIFVNIIRELLNDPKFLANCNLDDYELSREKNNFDICLHSKDNDNDIVLVLENKVKSIPSKAQLDAYVTKLQSKNKKKNNSNQSPEYLLLSLAEDFADKKAITNGRVWKIANYDNLKDAILKEKSNWQNGTGNEYVNDYCIFIELMHQLQSKVLDNFDNSGLFEDLIDYKSCRLHDLYIKLRCCKFIQLLEQELKNKGLPVCVFNNYDEIRKNPQKGVYLNYNIFKGTGQIAACIYTGGTDGEIYEVVIQGGQYRHGINSTHYILKNQTNIQSQEKIYYNLIKDQFNNSFLDLPFPESAKNGRTVALCGYGQEDIYRYDKIEKPKDEVQGLLNRMIADIEEVWKNKCLP